jgi:hypothetical protein
VIHMPSDLVPIPFAVVKFAADPIRDEPVNVGVVGLTGNGLEARFLDSFSRFKNVLSGEELHAVSVAVKFLRSSLDRSPESSLEHVAESLSGQLRLSDVMGGVSEDVAAFLDDQFEMYVSSSTVQARSRLGEDRKKIKDRIRKVIGGNGRQSELFALAKRRVTGELGNFSFDFGFVNGRATLLHAISFQTREEYALNEAKVLTWAALDTKKRHKDVAIAAVVAPPIERTAAYDEAHRVLASQAEVINANDEALEQFVGGILRDNKVTPIPEDWLIAAA